MSAYKRVLLIMTGSVSVYKAIDLLSTFKKKSIYCDVVMTKNSKKFIGEALVEAMTDRAPLSKLFDRSKMMDHIYLTRNYDLFLVYPASADFIARVANGRADCLASATLLALNYKKPLWIAPSMNPSMYANPATQENISKLQSWGAEFLGPNEGVVACGDQGKGRLIEPFEIMEKMINEKNINRLGTN